MGRREITTRQIKFSEVGDTAIGLFIGVNDVPVEQGSDTARQLHFQDANGVPYWFWESAAMSTTMMAAQEGTILEVTYTGQRNVGQPSPLKDFKIYVLDTFDDSTTTSTPDAATATA